MNDEQTTGKYRGAGAHRRGRRPAVAIGFLLALVLAGPARSTENIGPAVIDAIEEHLGKLEKLGFSGVVLIAQGGSVLLAEGYGLADRERGVRWTPATVATIGSITKQFTGAAVLTLAEQGRLAVTDPITEYFDDVPDDKRGITLHHLLTHASGIVDLDGAGDWDPIGREEFVRRALAQELAFDPGTDYQYSNAGYSLLGAIIEQLTGLSYERFLRRRLLEPAGLYETGYVLPRWGEGRLAQGYRDGERWGTVLERPLGEDGPYWVLRANGGLHTTAYDMLRWGQALLEGRALPKPALETYWTPYQDEGGGDSFYGYGWVVLDRDGTRVITHNGGNGIHFADMAIVPDRRLVTFLQTNVVAEMPMIGGLLESLGAALLTDRPLTAVPERAALEPQALTALAGEYVLASGGGARVEAADGELRVTPLDPVAFAHLASTRTVDPERAERLSARLGEIVEASLADDWTPLREAYRRQITEERLRERWGGQMAAWEEEHGALRGHTVVGTAFQEGRDVTLVRFDFAGGAEHRTYVWSPDDHEVLLGVSRRGTPAVLRLLPVAGGSFATWDERSGASRPVTLEQGPDGKRVLRLEVRN